MSWIEQMNTHTHNVTMAFHPIATEAKFGIFAVMTTKEASGPP